MNGIPLQNIINALELAKKKQIAMTSTHMSAIDDYSIIQMAGQIRASIIMHSTRFVNTIQN